MRGVPSDMQAGVIEYGDVVSEIKEYLVSRIKFAVSRGVSTENIVVDPGIGFGKTPAHNMEIIRRIGEFADIGRPVLVGASRKSFLGGIKGMKNPDERLFGTLAANLAAVSNGASIIRVHDVRAHSEFFRALAAIG
jgi:dihydropteroate synthase